MQLQLSVDIAGIAVINLPDLLGIVFTNIVNQYNGDGPNMPKPCPYFLWMKWDEHPSRQTQMGMSNIQGVSNFKPCPYVSNIHSQNDSCTVNGSEHAIHIHGMVLYGRCRDVYQQKYANKNEKSGFAVHVELRTSPCRYCPTTECRVWPIVARK